MENHLPRPTTGRTTYEQPFIYCENLQRLIPEPINLNKAVIDPPTYSLHCCLLHQQ